MINGAATRSSTRLGTTSRQTAQPKTRQGCSGSQAVNNSPFATIQAGEHHRDHAQVEQVFADWTDGPLAHLPSGSFPANAAWAALAAIAHNLLRAAGSLASLACAKARGATLRRDLIDVAARTARRGRGHLTLHLPEGWHREQEWMNLFEAACGPPAAAA
jgi:hypothetical protein